MLNVARAHFVQAGRCFVDLVDRVPQGAWDCDGLGEWDLRSLVGRTSRSLITVITYLQQPAAAEDVLSAALYYRTVSQQITANAAAVAERGRQAGVALGADPAASVHRLFEEAIAAVDAADDDPVMPTIAGGMRLSRYLPTRAFELTVHSLDIAAACGIELTPPAAALNQALHLAVDVAVLRHDGADVLLALTGRQSLPGNYSVV